MSKAAPQIVRYMLLAVGALVVVYAISNHPLYGGAPGFGWAQVLMTVVGVGLATCALLPTSIAGRVLLLALSSLVMLAMAEIVGEAVLGPRLRPAYQYDDRLIFKLIPNRQSV